MENSNSIEIEKYINDSRVSGMADMDIKNSLLASGWTEDTLSPYFQILTEPTQPKKKRRWLKILGITIASIVALGLFMLFVLPQILNAFWGNDVALNDADVQLGVVSIPLQDQNSYYDIIKLKDLVQEPTVADGDIATKYLAGKALDPAIEIQIIQKNSAVFTVLDNAATKSSFQDPGLADLNKYFLSIDTGPADLSPTDYLSSLRASTRLSILYADYLDKQGKPQEAMNRLFATLTIAQQIQKSQATFVHYLVTINMKKLAILKIQEILKTNTFSMDIKKQYSDRLDSLKNNSTDFDRALKSEYSYDYNLVDNTLAQATAGPVKKTNYTFKPNETKNMFADQVRKTILAANLNCGSTVDLTPQNYPINSFYIWTAAWRINSVGKLLFDLPALDVSASFTHKCEVDGLISNLRTQLSQ